MHPHFMATSYMDSAAHFHWSAYVAFIDDDRRLHDHPSNRLSALILRITTLCDIVPAATRLISLRLAWHAHQHHSAQNERELNEAVHGCLLVLLHPELDALIKRPALRALRRFHFIVMIGWSV